MEPCKSDQTSNLSQLLFHNGRCDCLLTCKCTGLQLILVLYVPMDLYHVSMYFKENIMNHEEEHELKEGEKVTRVDCVRDYLLDTWWLGELI